MRAKASLNRDLDDQVQETLSRLLTDESRTLKHLVDNAEKILRIDKATGDMVLSVPRAYVSDMNFLGLLLLSRYFASKLGLAKKEGMTLEEIIRRSGFDEATVTARMTELNLDGIVEHKPGGEYGISFSKAEYFLQEAGRDILEEGNKSALLAESFLVKMDPVALRGKGISKEAVMYILTTRRIV